MNSLSTHHILEESASPFPPHRLHSLTLHSDSVVCDIHLNPNLIHRRAFGMVLRKVNLKSDDPVSSSGTTT